jgi:hypothetical protein
MARSEVADGGDALQIWRVAANILNKQSRTADKEWSSSWVLGVWLTTPHRTNKLVMKFHEGPWTDSFDKRIKLQKMDMKFCTRNVRSLYRAVVKEISKYELDLVEVQNVRWDRGGIKPAGEYIFFC